MQYSESDVVGHRSDAFTLVFDFGLMAGCQSYDFAEELLVDLAIRVRHRLTANG